MLIGSKSERPKWLTGNLQGMLWMLTTAALIVIMHTMIRTLANDGMHPFVIGFFRTFFGGPIVAILLWKYGFGILRTDQLKVHGIRSFGHVVAMMMCVAGRGAGGLPGGQPDCDVLLLCTLLTSES